MGKEKNQNKKTKKILSRIIFIIIGIILLLTILFVINLSRPSSFEENTIVATKVEQYNGRDKKIKYEIKIKDYDLQSIIKTIEFDLEDTAQMEYEYYEFINKYERRNIGLELKGKKLILTMPEEQFKEDIGYDDIDNTNFTTAKGERKEIINQDALKETLRKQGYTIK